MTSKQDKARRPVYIGFSTVSVSRPPYTLTDIDLVKQDLLNTFKTLKGERVMLPTFGSDIPRYLFEPFDAYVKQAIIDDAIAVVETDPRVSLETIQVTELEYGLRIDMMLYYDRTQTAEQLAIDFLQDSEV